MNRNPKRMASRTSGCGTMALLVAGYLVTVNAASPAPAGWYIGDMHVHRSCGGTPMDVSTIMDTMVEKNIAVSSLLADMGNGEVQDPLNDLPKVTGQDDPVSTADHIIHWDAEWHWDATYTQYPHQALGGHLVALGLGEAHQIWAEHTYPVLDWARQQGGIAGFAHMQYLDNNIPQSLNCCIPIEYPIEVALGAADFISEDVSGGESAVQAYYRLLNCGFRPGFAGGSDHPCGAEVGSVLTYVQVAGGALSYRGWIEGIAAGRTVVSRSGHTEFLALTVNGTATPGDELQLSAPGSTTVNVTWTALESLTGTIELVQNGVVVASKSTSVGAGSPDLLSTSINFTKSGWLAARRMDAVGHKVHTAAVFVLVNGAPIRTSEADAQFYVNWADNLIQKTSVGGDWVGFFSTSREAAQARYQQAKALYQQILTEAQAQGPLAVATVSLPEGAVGVAYTASLAANGGTLPYTWSLIGGSLPTGLTLDPSTGVISGTPIAAGTPAFTVQVADGATPSATATASLTLTTYVSGSVATIWPVTAVPTVVDGGADSPVELGVKFRSDVAGVVTGIRFYKASANTGTHVGHLWSSTGTLLASATFVGETGSGWQQVSFASPVSVAANTTYIASYHCLNGHYSADVNYFAAARDNAPLHALASGTSGGNGVYAYGSAGSFPNATWNAANYWVDVVLSSAPPPTLASITVSPANPAVAVGGTQQFTAIGTYSDGSTQGLTSQVTWSSSETGVATINSGGTATGLAVGGTTIRATLAGVSGASGLTVLAAPVAVATTALANGTIGVAYSAGLTATGGTPPYTWSLVGGTLPAGLSLSSGGLISGTPTAMGASSFTVQVSDAASQIATKPLGLTISPNVATIWAATAVPTLVDGGADSAVELGVKFQSEVAGTITGIRFYKASANTGTHVGNLWSNAGTLLASATFTGETASGWQQVSFASPVAIQANTTYVASYRCPNGHYSADVNYFATARNNPPLHALASGSSGGNGVFRYGSTSLFPNQAWNAANYWVDVVFVGGPPPSLVSIAVTPANPAVLEGGTQQFTATGTYSDGSTQNLTSSAAWSSSATAVATVNAVGLATGVSGGTATVSATVSGLSGNTVLTVHGLQTVTVTPADASLPVGLTQQFTATGTYADGSTQNLTSTATWSSSATTVATVSAGGLATSVAPGQTTITATRFGKAGSTTLTVPDPATLTSIVLTPANPSVVAGATQQFTATGNYSDGSTQNLTGSTTWTSSSTAVATIASGGLATSLAPGSTTIRATLGAVSGETVLSVQPPPLSVATTALANGTIGVAYSAGLTATGGTPPYTWSLAGGTLPAGLSLSSGGVISGTPTTVGASSFTVQVSDAAAQIATKALSLTISPNVATLWAATAVPTVVDGGADSAVELGVKFQSEVAGTITGIRFYKASANTGTHVGNLWSDTGTLLASATFTGETASGWQQVSFASPVAIQANTTYVASYRCPNGHYSADVNYFATARHNPPLHALASGSSGGNGVFRYGSTSLFPNQTWNAANYWVDVVFVGAPPPSLVSIAVTPANPAVLEGGTQQFTATGTYSDGSTQNLTSSAAWSSSATAVATVNAAGLATGVAGGTATVSATLSGLSGNAVLTVHGLQTVVVTPADASLPVGLAQQFTATGTYADGSTQNLTSTAAWSSSATTVATVSAGGLATSVAPGQTTITATRFGKAGSTTLTAPAPATLTSIVLTPANPSVVAGATQQFTATGNYSDGSTQNLTGVAAWTSTAPGVATVAAGGLASSLSPGAAIIQAAFGGVMSETVLTVLPAPLVVTTTALPNGTIGAGYNATLAATGGTPPYTWSLANGSLPQGLELSSAGVISGTPTAAETVALTLQVTDAASQTASTALSFTVSAAVATIWSATTVPVRLDEGPDSPVELGVKFRADVAGTVTGVRFYKAAANTGTHVGNLWSATGTRLATATFTGESASGWQQVSFGAPVPIEANTTYIASYHCPGGHYSGDLNYFATAQDNPPLHALASAASGGNGVFRYGSTSEFPDQTWNAANYWVDVVFVPASQGPDTTPPLVIGLSPANAALGVSTGTAVTATFNEAMNAGTITSATMWLRDFGGNLVSSTVSYDAGSRVASLIPTSLLTPGTVYVATVKGGSGGATDLAGNPMSGDVGWSFTTLPPNPYGNGPGGPILLITDQANRFTEYYAEILLNEGLNAFTILDIGAVSPANLPEQGVVILGEIALTPAEVSMLADWVNAGGNLVAMRPDKQLAPLLGLADAGTVLSEAYLQVNTSTGPGLGIVGETIQFHGAADGYTVSDATSLATLFSNAVTPSAYPAVTLRAVGSNGGQAAAFTFDLARSVVYTRQGNPAWANQERDGFSPMRANDLFYGGASFDPQPDWVNLDKVAIPQADEQQRLLANLIIHMAADRFLLPRFWYFPRGLPAVVVMTGDDHGNDGTEGRFAQYLALDTPGASVEDWETVRSSSYIYADFQGAMTDAEAAVYQAAGFELGLHINTGCADYTREELEAFFTSQLGEWRSFYPSLFPPATHRAHCIAWSGYTTMAEVEHQFGIRLDVNYYYWPPDWVSDRSGLYTGSGMPMRFATADGQVLDVFQATTQLTDESGQTYPDTMDALLDRALGPEGYYGAFVANIHTDSSGAPESDSILSSALSRNVPIISARQLLTWLDARNASSLQPGSWAGNTQTFTVQANPAARGLQVLLPVPDGQTVASATYDGTPVAFELKLVKGIVYAAFPAVTGGYAVTFGPASP